MDRNFDALESIEAPAVRRNSPSGSVRANGRPLSGSESGSCSLSRLSNRKFATRKQMRPHFWVTNRHWRACSQYRDVSAGNKTASGVLCDTNCIHRLRSENCGHTEPLCRLNLHTAPAPKSSALSRNSRREFNLQLKVPNDKRRLSNTFNVSGVLRLFEFFAQFRVGFETESEKISESQ